MAVKHEDEFIQWALDVALSNYKVDGSLKPSKQDYEATREYFPDREDGEFTIAYSLAVTMLRKDGTVE